MLRPSHRLRAAFAVAPLLVVFAIAPAAAQGELSLSRQVESGLDALQQGDAARAASAFRDAISVNAQDPIAYYGAGAAAHLLGRDDEARAQLARALELAPRFSGASALLGEIAYRQGDVTLAIRTYEKALAFAPRNQELQRRLAEWRTEAALPRRADGPYNILFQGPAQEKLAARATAVLDAAYWRIGRALGAYPSNPITVVLYTEKQFHDITGVPEWSDGSFDTRIRIPVRGALVNPAQFDRVLTHELVHAMIAGLANRGVPAWLHEGLATSLEPNDPAAAERRLRAAQVFVPLADLETGFSGLTDRQAAVAYDESLIAAAALVKRIGTQVGVLIEAVGSGSDVAQAMQRFGISYRDFESDIAARVESRAATRLP